MFAEEQDCPLRCQHQCTVEQLVHIATFGHCTLFCSGCLLFVLGFPVFSLRAAFSISVVFPLLVSVVFVSS